jgi:hypothetical protein
VLCCAGCVRTDRVLCTLNFDSAVQSDAARLAGEHTPGPLERDLAQFFWEIRHIAPDPSAPQATDRFVVAFVWATYLCTFEATTTGALAQKTLIDGRANLYGPQHCLRECCMHPISHLREYSGTTGLAVVGQADGCHLYTAEPGGLRLLHVSLMNIHWLDEACLCPAT